VGWKDTTEARRAIADSLPLLRKAKEVTVAEVLERDDQRSAATSRVTDVVAWLSRHGVSATARVSENNDESRDTGVQIDDIAAQIGAGLIVAAAYGHSRFRDLVLGGMTEHLLSQSARCVLLSH